MKTTFSRFGLGAALAGSTALVATLLGAPSAHAKTAIAVDLNYAVPIDSDAESGGGFAIRVGQQFHAPLIVLVPELEFADHSFSSNGPTVYQGLAGLRLGLGEVIRPGVYAHLGLGHTSDPSKTGFSYDGGAFLDITILPLLDLGVHGAYNRMNLGTVDTVGGGEETLALEWVTLGAHAALVF